MATFVILNKPPMGTPCNRCGFCCEQEACELSRSFLHSRQAPCIALEVEATGEFSCGLLKRPLHYIDPTWPEDEGRAEVDDGLRQSFKVFWSGLCTCPDELWPETQKSAKNAA